MTHTPSPKPEHRSSGARATPVTPASVREVEAQRREIVARLTRLHCQQRGACTRSCRRQKRCVVADALERDARGQRPVPLPRGIG